MKIRKGQWAFTLLEVMIASAIFFICIFAILEVITRSLRSAHALTDNRPHAGMIASMFVLTNRLEEGFETGDFGEVYPGYSWTREVIWVGSNGLFRVDFAVYREVDVDSELSIIMYSPASPNPTYQTGGGPR